MFNQLISSYQPALAVLVSGPAAPGDEPFPAAPLSLLFPLFEDPAVSSLSPQLLCEHTAKNK